MSTVDPHGPTAAPAGAAGFRERFRAWRAQRPFWGCAVSIAGGVWIYGGTLAPLGVVQSQGMAGILSLSVFLLTIILAGTTLFQPHLRSLTGLIVVVLGPLSILAVNLGGFVVGMILLVVGGGMMFAWMPAEEEYDPDYVSGAPLPEEAHPVGRHRGAGSPDHTRDPARVTTQATTQADAPPPGPRIDLRERRPGGSPLADLPARPSRPTPASPARRAGLAGVLDTMFGSRISSSRPRGAKPAAGPARGPRPAPRSGPAAGQRRPGPAGKPSTPGQSGTPGQPGQRRRPSGTPPQGRAPLTPPSDPPKADARTWLIVPALLLTLVAPALVAPSAQAAPAADEPGWFDWLFPPKTPAPSGGTGGTATPSPSATDPGFVLPGLGRVKIGTPKPPAGTPRETEANCPPKQAQDGGATQPGPAANGAVELIRECLGAGEEALGLVSGNAPPPPAGLPRQVSDEKLVLKASKLSMKGLGYQGLVTLQTKSGPKKVMHFTANEVDIDNLDQQNSFTGGATVLKSLESNTAILSGNVNLFVDSMDSKLFGLVPLKFDKKFQPPLVFDNMFFTDALTEVSLVTCDKILLPKVEIRVS